MTDDIVTRLRVTSGAVHPMLEERAEAADEIERLRKDNDRLRHRIMALTLKGNLIYAEWQQMKEGRDA